MEVTYYPIPYYRYSCQKLIFILCLQNKIGLFWDATGGPLPENVDIILFASELLALGKSIGPGSHLSKCKVYAPFNFVPSSKRISFLNLGIEVLYQRLLVKCICFHFQMVCSVCSMLRPTIENLSSCLTMCFNSFVVLVNPDRTAFIRSC